MDSKALLKPTLHIEVMLREKAESAVSDYTIRQEVIAWCLRGFVRVKVGQRLGGDSDLKYGDLVKDVEVADYTGTPNSTGYYNIREVELDVQTYILRPERESEDRRSIAQLDGELPQARILALPNIALKDEWSSLVFDDALPARLLRYLVRMIEMMNQPGLSLSTFNWNRLCLLHGPPGSGKSTLCRALVQKLSIRLGDTFAKSMLIEINTNSMLSKYFGESGKLIGGTFDQIHGIAQDPRALICVVMDEVETIAGNRERSTSGSECNDGLRATNQLLTALDRMRGLPNVIVLCTSNLITAIDRAFLDRVDIKQLIPCPSPAAIYNIFQSCLNELIRSKLVDFGPVQISTTPTPTHDDPTQAARGSSSSSLSSSPSKQPIRTAPLPPEPWTLISTTELPTLAQMRVRLIDSPQSPGRRVWAIAEQCQGLSGRTLRRLPILALAMYTYGGGGGTCTLPDAISALQAAVEQELHVAATTTMDGKSTQNA